ncbi:MAG: MarR family transcriptional regulator [Pusillimonas sp.]|nr:MarR family transcriptional regulator [Pusillimonas sp.]|tara:strand:- start:7397 stop:7927 length:531 start_codon:yes stop_codon:yes gene_type:complete
MDTKPKGRSIRPNPDNCPWTNVQEDGRNLTVDQFPSTVIVQLANSLRREVTTKYAEKYGLTVSEWRLLSLLARFAPIPFGELVALSGSDKALVSRTLRALEQHGFCKVQPEPGGHKKKLICEITQAGLAKHEIVMPVAQRLQAAVLAQLTKTEREIMYSALMKLHEACDSGKLTLD